MKYIAYGANMSREQMALRCPTARFLYTGQLKGWQLEFYIHATVTRVRNKAAYVRVAIWEITAEDEKSLDQFEGYPFYYTKQTTTVSLADGSQIKGMLYIMRELSRPYPPGSGYYRGIHEAYLDLGLGLEIKQALQPAYERSCTRAGRA